MQFWKFQTCPKTWKIGMHFSFNIPVTMQFQKFCRPAWLSGLCLFSRWVVAVGVPRASERQYAMPRASERQIND